MKNTGSINTTMLLPLNNHYALLALMLSPALDNITINTLRSAIHNNHIIWVNLLQQAGVQRCTPLLFVRLNQYRLWSELPAPIQQIIQAAYQKNLQRNAVLQTELSALLAAFQHSGIESLLLKGAATFCDNLYGDPGARVMGDLDILVHPNDVEKCKKILTSQGYIVIPDPGMTFDGLATDMRHHQIPAYRHPTTKVIIEIHFNVSYGQAGRVIPTEQAWTNCLTTTLNGHTTSLLSTQDRLLLNTAHALLPKREFIRGEIALLQLAEFSLLITERSEEISWNGWANVAQLNHLETAFMTYLLMSHELMSIAWPLAWPVPTIAKNNYRRIQANTNENPALVKQHYRTRLQADYYRYFYYYLRLPGWVWRNVCYAPGIKNLPARVIQMVKVVFRGRSWTRI